MKKSITDIANWQGRRALVRVDFNVPLDEHARITDDTRIREALPTLRYLVQHGAKVILMSHLGRPKKQVVESLRLTPVAEHLQTLMPETKVRKTTEVYSAQVVAAVESLQPGEILLLENTRFEPGEEANDPQLAQNLASLGDVFVNDAFGAAHRAHASTEGLAHFVSEKVAGFLMQKEIDALTEALQASKRPYTAIIGGSKISTKITVLENLLKNVDRLIIGGGMRFTFFAAQGHSVGDSLCEPDFIDTAKRLMEQAKAEGKTLYLTRDVVVADRFDKDANRQVVAFDAIPDGWGGMDIGPESIADIEKMIADSALILWNGPVGVFEFPNFSQGTRAVAEAVANSSAMSILGGGDTVAAIEAFGIDPARYTHVSTGGGASLEFLEGKTLPGIAVLDEALATR
jgi:phosphoglycerate kinase